MSPAWVLFSGGYATRLFVSQWQDAGALEPLSARERLANEDGSPTEYFRKLFRSAFPAKDELPDVIATPEGKGTQRFLETFR